MKRDEFKNSVKSALRERVAYRCSNPNCRVPTAGPGEGSEGITRIGDAAHITAAASKGPRYDASLSTEERRSIDNGIWLCKPCATKIDSQHKSHPVSLLRSWKADAEEKAAREMGRPIPDEKSVRQELVSALTGAPSLSNTIIHNAHSATREALENLDKRFTVTTSHSNGRTEIALHANERVDLSIKIKTNKNDNYEKKFDEYFSSGESITIPTDGIEITGSPLVEHAFNRQEKSGTASLRFEAPKFPAILKLTLISPNKASSHQFDDVRGFVTGGYKKLTFKGTTFENVMSIQITNTISDLPQGTANFSFDLTPWIGVDVRYIPNLEDLLTLLDLMSKGWEIDVQLKSRGSSLYKGKLNSEDFISGTTATIASYTNLAKKLATALKQPIYFRSAKISSEDHRNLHEYLKPGVPGIYQNSEFPQANLSANLIADNEGANIEIIKNIKEPITIRYVDAENWEFSVFDTPMKLPKRTIVFNGVTPRLEESSEKFIEGDEVSVEWIPEKSFNWHVEYERSF